MTSQTITSRYQQAQTLVQGLSTKNLVQNDVLFPHWIEGTDCFWYECAIKIAGEPPTASQESLALCNKHSEIGKEFRLVDARVATNNTAFDHNALAVALEQAVDQPVDNENLPISYVAISLSHTPPFVVSVSFLAFDQHWLFSSENNDCQKIDSPVINAAEALSPDGQCIAFVQDYNLWLRDLRSGEERPLTFDGEENYAYGIGSTAWGASNPPEKPALWSPNSIGLLFILRDKRKVLTLPMVDHVPTGGSLRPALNFTKVAYPGDEQVETFQLLAMDTSNGKICTPDYPPLPSGLNNNMGLFFANIAWWGNDSQHAYFIDQERGDRVVRLVEFDTHTGHTRVLFEEQSETHINILTGDYLSPTAHRYLASSNELIWWSERNGWGHLYLYDLATGRLKRQITGQNQIVDSDQEWSVRDVLHVDEERREILIQTGGRVVGREPYYRDICRVNIDTSEFTEVYSCDEDVVVHYPETWTVYIEDSLIQRANKPSSGISSRGDYLVITRSRVDKPPVHELLDRNGQKLMGIEASDIENLPQDWTWPEPVEILAADGITPLYGVLYRPSNFSPDKQYPVINHTCAGAWQSMVPKGSFHSSRSVYTDMHYFHGAALAELGFIVLQLDSRGTPLRGKSFQDESYGWAPSACNKDDHVGAIKQLAQRYPSMDLDRVGSFSLGYLSGLIHFLECQDIYKVHVQTRILDERFLASTICGDKWEGCNGPSNDKKPAEDLVKNLNGKLLLMHAMNDSQAGTYIPAATLRVADALQKANKDFDMLMVPGSNSSYEKYVTRKTFDYLVKHLLGEEPPKEFDLEASFV